jgi:hypothetical protein
MKNFYYLIEKDKTPSDETDFDILMCIKDDTSANHFKIDGKLYEKYDCTGKVTWSHDYNEIIIYSENKQNGIIAIFNKKCDYEKFTIWENGKKKTK